MEYQGWINPYGASMADTIARSHDAEAHAAEMTAQARARAAEIRGQAWAGATARIGQTLGAIPAQLEQAKDARIERALKQDELASRVQSRQETNRQRIVLTIGRLANGSKSADDFVSGLDDMAGLGGLPRDVAAHIKGQVQSAGPDGWDAVKTKYVEFGSQYQDAIKLGEKDRLVNPMTGATKVDAVPETKILTPGSVAIREGAPGQPATTVGSAPFSPAASTAVVNGAVVPLTGPTAGVPVAPAVPKQEGASEVGLNNARVDEINKKIEELDNQIAGTMPITAKDNAELAIQRQRLEIERQHYRTIENGQNINSPKNQEHLEESYRQLLKTTQSSRSGGLGLEDKKVDQAKHLMTLLDQTRDPKTGSYRLTAQQQTELSVGLATLLSPTGVPGEATVKSLTQATASGDFGKVAGYVLGEPIAGTPDAVARQLYETIERQGVQAEQNREGHFSQLRAFAPTDLNADRRAKLEAGLVGANRISVEVQIPGAAAPLRFPTRRAADKFIAEAKAKGLLK